MSADEKPSRDRAIIVNDSARKRYKKVLAYYNKTRINVHQQYDRWMELKEALRV